MTDAVPRILIETTQTLDTMLHQVLNQALVAIGAKAGSLMLVDTKQGILQINARLGEPRPGRKSERVFKTSDQSIAAWTVRKKRSYLCGDVTQDRIFSPSRSGHNFDSVLSVPIVHEGKVLAVINADSTSPAFFTDRHRVTLEAVAAQAAQPIAERISIIDALAEVGVELTRMPSKGGVDRVLEKIAELAVRSLGADAVTVYQYDQARDAFLVEGTGPTTGGVIHDTQPMQRNVFPGDVPWTVVQERRSGFYSNVKGMPFLTRDVMRPGQSPRPRFVSREGIESMAALLLPYRAAEVSTEEVVGVMFANYRTPHTFNIDEVGALATFADYAAVAILNARHEEHRRAEQMKMVESISVNFAHRMSDLAGPGRVAAQLLRERVDRHDEVAHRQLEMIEREANVLLALAQRLVGRFTETGGITQLTAVNVPGLIDEALALALPDPGKVQMTARIEADLPLVQSVEFQLRHVLYDVVRNAVEAMAGQSRQMLSITARFVNATQRLEIEVSDTGQGIPEAVRDRLFSPGLTTKKEGLGVGLWYSRTFLQSTGGDLTLKSSDPSSGTVFLISLPSDSPALMASPGLRLELDVLIVDDEPAWCETIRDALPREISSVRTATSYGQAFDALTTTSFKLLVIDIQLTPGDPTNRDGERLLKELPLLGTWPKVIVVAKDVQHVVDPQAPWMMGVLSKPGFRIDEFRRLVREAMSSREPAGPPSIAIGSFGDGREGTAGGAQDPNS